MPLKQTVKFDVRGLPEVKAAFEGVKAGVQNRVLKAALRKVASTANKTAKSGVTGRRTGQLKRSVGLVYRAYRKGGGFAFVVGPRKGFKVINPETGKNVDPVFYAHLVEGGRRAVAPVNKRVLATGAKGRGAIIGKTAAAVAGEPFVGPARARAATEVKARVPGEVAKGVAAEARKYAKKGKSIMLK